MKSSHPSMSYPFWEKNRADKESSNAFHARMEADKCKKQLEAVEQEIRKYQILESESRTKEKMVEVLDKISEIVLK